MNTAQLNPSGQPYMTLPFVMKVNFCGFGSAFIIVAAFAFGHLASTETISTFIVGAILLVGALLHLGQAYGLRQSEAARPWTVNAIFYLFAGFAIMIEPVAGIMSLTLALAVTLAISGVARLVAGIRHGGDYVMLSGALTILVGAAIGMDWPRNSLFAIANLVAADLLIQGLMLFATGLTGRFVHDVPDHGS
jgi:uncharacterized membrane protein HdeD (DUF308 family)